MKVTLPPNYPPIWLGTEPLHIHCCLSVKTTLGFDTRGQTWCQWLTRCGICWSPNTGKCRITDCDPNPPRLKNITFLYLSKGRGKCAHRYNTCVYCKGCLLGREACSLVEVQDWALQQVLWLSCDTVYALNPIFHSNILADLNLNWLRSKCPAAVT